MTTYLAVAAPTGYESAGIAEPGWTFALHVLTVLGLGNFGAQINVAAEPETEVGIALEGNLATAYFPLLASEARLMSSPVVDVDLEAPVRGKEVGGTSVAITPGLAVGIGGWHVRLGGQLPVTDHREVGLLGLAQVGHHAPGRSPSAVS